MRAEVPVVLLAGLALLVAGPGARAQESASLPEIDEARFLAEQAALPYLGGSDPFVLRESGWSGRLSPGGEKLIQVQLFRRNEYRFWFALPNRQAVASVNIYNGEGELIETETVWYAGKHVVGTAIRPGATGIHYVRIAITRKSEQPEDWSVIYAYR